MIQRTRRTRIVCAALVVGFVCSKACAQNIHWTRTNPGGGGAFSTMKAGPSGIIIAGSDLSGAYRSMDKGKSWDVLGPSRGVTATHISGIGFDPNNEKVIFLGTTKGIYRSTDKGNSFTQPVKSGYVTDITVAKTNSSIVYAAYHSGYDTTVSSIYKSTNGGTSFNKVSNATVDGLRILRIVVDRGNANTLYIISGPGRFACSKAALFRSTNGGSAWSRLAANLGEILGFDLHPDNTSTMYLTTMNADCSAQWYYTDREGSFYKSTNRGNSWRKMSDRTGVILVKEDDSSVIRRIDPRNTADWNSESGAWGSTDSGATWKKTGEIKNWGSAHEKSNGEGYGNGFNGIATTIGTDMSDPDVILWINHQWAFRSADGGKTFTNVYSREVSPGFWQSTGIDNINVQDMVVSEADDNIMYFGAFDIGFWRSLDHGRSWQNCNNANFTGVWGIGGGNVASIVADPTRANVVWATQSNHQRGKSPTYLIKSTNKGERSSWVASNAGLPLVEVMGLSFDKGSPSTNRTLFVTAEGNVYRSTDDGANWSKVLKNKGLRFTAVDPFDGKIVYAGGGHGLWRSTDGGTNWSDKGTAEMKGTTEFWMGGIVGLGVFDITPDPIVRNRVYVTVFGDGKGLYRSNDRGATWKKLYTNDHMRKVDVSPLDENIVIATSSKAMTWGGYSGVSKGVLYSKDAFATAPVQENQGMAWPFAITVVMDKRGEVFVGSPGTGYQVGIVPGTREKTASPVSSKN